MRKKWFILALALFLPYATMLNAEVLDLGTIETGQRGVDNSYISFPITIRYDTNTLLFALSLEGKPTDSTLPPPSSESSAEDSLTPQKTIPVYFELIGVKTIDGLYELDVFAAVSKKFKQWSEVAAINNIKDIKKEMLKITTKSSWYINGRWFRSYQAYTTIKVVFYVIDEVPFVAFEFPTLVSTNRNKPSDIELPDSYWYESTFEAVDLVASQEKLTEKINELEALKNNEELFY